MPMKAKELVAHLRRPALAALVLTAGLQCGTASARHHAHAATTKKSAADHRLTAPLRTGSVLRNVEGKMILKPGVRYPEFQFINPKKDWPHAVKLLPCLALQAMESIDRPHIGFIISGILSQYHHQLYLLPSADVRLLKKHPKMAAAAPPSAATQPEIAAKAQKTSAQAVLNSLLAHHISRPIEQLVTIKPMLRARPIPDLPMPAGSGSSAALREGSYIWNRPGRLLLNQQLDEWIFVFQADSTRLSEPPLIMLPCHLLDRMEKRSQRVGTEIQFRISGKITQFKGRNYIFPIYENVAHNLGRF